MKSGLPTAFLAAWLLPASNHGAVAVLDQLHVISVHVPNHAAFDAVFLFFRDSLELPVVYGTLSKVESPNERLYAGFSVGNAYLEPCGPYSGDAPFTPSQPARFHGLTFATGTTLANDAQELSRRLVGHSEVLGSGASPRFVYISDEFLTGKLQAVSLWEIMDKTDRVNPGFLNNSLHEAKGGALGVRRLAEVRIGYPSKRHLDRWATFLRPARHKGKVWFVGNGAALRFVPARETQIEAIVLKVDSLSNARRVLTQKGLASRATAHALELDGAKTCGLRILLVE